MERWHDQHGKMPNYNGHISRRIDDILIYIKKYQKRELLISMQKRNHRETLDAD